MFSYSGAWGTSENSGSWKITTTTGNDTDGTWGTIYYPPVDNNDTYQYTTGYWDVAPQKEKELQNKKCEYCGCFSKVNEYGRCICCGAPKEK